MKSRDSVEGLGDKLKSVRLASGLTQVQAAEKSGILQVTISAYEVGRKTPTLAVLYRLAAAYGVDVCELLPKVEKAVPEERPKKAKGKAAQ